MPITKLIPENNYPYLQQRMDALQQAVPEAFADGKINWDTLREVLGEELEDPREEFFGLTWPGKREARKLASIPSRGTLVPVPGEGVNEDETENLFIEGDNLEVLKLLLKSYAGKIKMIYIDPPYNTGNDFIYNDSFTDPLDAYLKYTGAKGEGGELLTTNTRADGRFHSRWMNMMYPRLILARNLLSVDGVVFVSIDDNEVHNLRQMMNEVFGEETFIESLVWKKRATAPNDREIGRNHEYILVYSKTDSFTLGLLPRPDRLVEKYKNPDNDPNGPWTANDLSANGKGGRLVESLIFGIFNSETKETYYPPPGKCWLYNKYKIDEYIKEGRVSFRKSNGKPFLKRYLSEVRDGITCPTILENSGFSSDSSSEIKALFHENVFDFPKPVKLLSTLINLGANNKNDIVMDFFAGSSTTAHAIIKLNAKDYLNRKYIMVQLPEPTFKNSEAYKKGYQTISEISKERIRRAINTCGLEKKEEYKKTPLLINEIEEMDLGFKVYRFVQSNFKHWDLSMDEPIRSLTLLFQNFSDSLANDWLKEDLMSELLLLEGFPLTSKIVVSEEFHQNQLYQVNAPDFCTHSLFVCLDEQIHPNTVDLLKMKKEDIFICLDSALSDELKATLQDRFNVHVI